MIYSKNANDVLLLEAELKKLKDLYSEALHKGDPLTDLKDLRKRIKLVSARLITYNNPNSSFSR